LHLKVGIALSNHVRADSSGETNKNVRQRVTSRTCGEPRASRDEAVKDQGGMVRMSNHEIAGVCLFTRIVRQYDSSEGWRSQEESVFGMAHVFVSCTRRYPTRVLQNCISNHPRYPLPSAAPTVSAPAPIASQTLSVGPLLHCSHLLHPLATCARCIAEW
jgi:hypothetical protein